MLREKATKLADLPHQYDQVEPDICRVCWGTELDARHLAWERAAADQPTPDVLPRERGV